MENAVEFTRMNSFSAQMGPANFPRASGKKGCAPWLPIAGSMGKSKQETRRFSTLQEKRASDNSIDLNFEKQHNCQSNVK